MEEKCEETPRSIGGKRCERPSCSSLPEILPNKSTKTSEYLMAEQNDLAGIWSALNKIQRNKDELLKENQALCDLYNELQRSLEFHISKSLEANIEALKTEKKEVMKNDISPEGITVKDPTSILSAIKSFYKQLYTSQKQLAPADSLSFCEYQSLPRLDDEKQSLCEGLITAEECLAALKTFQHNKSPGRVPEFYLCYWKELSGPLIECLNHGALLGELSISQRRGTISLIPKKNKDPLLAPSLSLKYRLNDKNVLQGV
ncbi:hypothetical protein ACROYT_G013663 [Oculina patagonica]